jgi:hypothetical protein
MHGANDTDVQLVPLAGCWWLVCSEKKYCWLVADKPIEQGGSI